MLLSYLCYRSLFLHLQIWFPCWILYKNATRRLSLCMAIEILDFPEGILVYDVLILRTVSLFFSRFFHSPPHKKSAIDVNYVHEDIQFSSFGDIAFEEMFLLNFLSCESP